MKTVTIVMPQMGQSVAEGTIIKWHKHTGDDVREDEIVVQVETDKTNVDVESPAGGRLTACLKREGEQAAAGEPIGMIETEDDTIDPGQRIEEGDAPLAMTPFLPDIDRDRYSPYVLRLALHNNISLQELNQLTGTGRNGRLTKSDLLQHLARRPTPSITVEGVAAGRRGEAIDGRQDLSEEELARLGEVRPMNSVRRTIADHMIQSLRTSAHVTMVHLVDLTHVVELRDRVKDAFLRQYGARLTYTGVLLFVTARVLRAFPTLNAMVHGTNLILRKDINIGCAVALPDESLVVPVVRHADRKSFPEIAADLDRLIGLARNKSLKRSDVEHGTFSISNFGSFGSIIGTPLINQPQVAILGMGAVVRTPAVMDDRIAIRDRLYLSLSFDHRVIDGAMGGRFLNAIQRATEALTEDDLQVKRLKTPA